MKKIPVILLFLLMSCSSDDSEKVIIQEIPTNSIDLQIGGNTTHDNSIKVSAFYTCEEDLSISVTSKTNIVTSDLFHIIKNRRVTLP
jgi:hypothetical protein